MLKTRIRECKSFDNPAKSYFVIDETVTTTGLYITWPGIYDTRENAQKEINTVAGITAKNIRIGA